MQMHVCVLSHRQITKTHIRLHISCRRIGDFRPLLLCMRGSSNFHERGSNENVNFWSQTRGGPIPLKSRNYFFLGKIFKFQGGSGPPAPPPSGSAHALVVKFQRHVSV